MADDIFPVLLKPQPTIEADVPYTGLFVYLSMAPRVDAGRADATISMLVRPYRRLKDGTLDEAPRSMERGINIGSVLDLKADLQGDPSLLEAVDSILQALKKHLANG
jgi:hypothetical protein